MPDIGDGEEVVVGSDVCLDRTAFLFRGGGRGGGLRVGCVTGELVNSTGLAVSGGDVELLSLVTVETLSAEGALPCSAPVGGLYILPFLRLGNGGGRVEVEG